jgi:polysaccharide biosynthesis protein PslG
MRFILALLVALFCAPHPAAASAPREFYGVVAANDPDQTELARMRAGRVGTLRINFVWGAVESGPGAQFDWSHYDTLIGEAAAQGIRVLPTVYSSPLWAAARDNYPPSPGSLGDYAAFVEAAAARYGSNGTFWAENPDIPRLPVRWWQLWNEPNLQVFWLPKLSARSYVDLLRVFSPAIRRGDPNARVLLAGLFPGPFTPGVVGIPLARYLPAIYRQRKAKTLFDGVDLHPYANTPNLVIRDVTLCRRIMSRFKDQKTPLWLTEVGWTTGGDPSRLTVSPRRQAAYLKRTYRLLATNRKRDRIAGAIWYSWKDQPGSVWFDHTGLFTTEFQPKPSWYAFVNLTGGSPGASPVEPPYGG